MAGGAAGLGPGCGPAARCWLAGGSGRSSGRDRSRVRGRWTGPSAGWAGLNRCFWRGVPGCAQRVGLLAMAGPKPVGQVGRGLPAARIGPLSDGLFHAVSESARRSWAESWGWSTWWCRAWLCGGDACVGVQRVERASAASKARAFVMTPDVSRETAGGQRRLRSAVVTASDRPHLGGLARAPPLLLDRGSWGPTGGWSMRELAARCCGGKACPGELRARALGASRVPRSEGHLGRPWTRTFHVKPQATSVG